MVSCNLEILRIPGHTCNLTFTVDFSRVTGVFYFLNDRKEAGTYEPNTRMRSARRIQATRRVIRVIANYKIPPRLL